MRRAFTLIEILIAASVLGLGVLGIATLFAGAARQQQIASEQTSSQRDARNIDALLGERYDRFAGVAFDENASTGPFFRLGQWHPVASIPFGGVAGGRLRGALSLDMSDDLQSNQTAFGVDELGDVILYSLNGGLLREEWPIGAAGSATPIWVGAGVGPASPGQTFAATDLNVIADQGLASFPNYIPSGRLQPTVTIEVDVYKELRDAFTLETLGLTTPDDPDDATRRFEFLDPDDVTEPRAVADHWPFLPPASPDRLELIDAAQADAMNRLPSDADRVRLELQTPDSNDPPFAYLRDSASAMSLVLPDNSDDGERHTIGQIRATGVEVRGARLLSLDERLSYTDDDAFPGGRRPTGGVALLFKRGENADQLMAISYTLEPLGRVQFDPDANERSFVPPDDYERLYDTSSDPASYGLLSQVRLELSYDDANQVYVLTASDTADEWAIQKGQIVVIASGRAEVDPQSAGRPSDPLDEGAIGALEIRASRRAANGDLEGVLSAPPYLDGFRPMLERFTDTRNVWVWAVRDVVRSGVGGAEDVDWRVRATGARLITFGGN